MAVRESRAGQPSLRHGTFPEHWRSEANCDPARRIASRASCRATNHGHFIRAGQPGGADEALPSRERRAPFRARRSHADQRNDLKAARTSVEKSSGSSHAAK